MDAQIFVQNIKYYCNIKGVKPTVACRESGVGSSFINNLERGQTPSVAKVQMLADYLGVTTSELLGEKTKPTVQDDGLSDAEQALMDLFPKLNTGVRFPSPAPHKKLAKALIFNTFASFLFFHFLVVISFLSIAAHFSGGGAGGANRPHSPSLTLLPP